MAALRDAPILNAAGRQAVTIRELGRIASFASIASSAAPLKQHSVFEGLHNASRWR